MQMQQNSQRAIRTLFADLKTCRKRWESLNTDSLKHAQNIVNTVLQLLYILIKFIIYIFIFNVIINQKKKKKSFIILNSCYYYYYYYYYLIYIRCMILKFKIYIF